MASDIILKLSQKVNALLARDDVDGVVITHGTDTLDETAYFLNLTVKSDKPVVFTAAMPARVGNQRRWRKDSQGWCLTRSTRRRRGCY